MIDAVTSAVETRKEVAICGSEGSRMLVASVPDDASAARIATRREVEVAVSPWAAPETVWSVTASLICFWMIYII